MKAWFLFCNTKRICEWYVTHVLSISVRLLIGIIISTNYTYAQDILIPNPSLEKPVWLSKNINWEKSGTPDIQPGVLDCNFPASDGNSYIGMVYTPKKQERIGQKLSVKLKAGTTYTLSFDLAYLPLYSQEMCNGSFAIYGGSSVDNIEDTLWKSGKFYHTTWKRYTAVFTPAKDHSYIIFAPYISSDCKSQVSLALIDNFSSAINTVPQVEITVKSTCKGANTGIATAIVKDGQGPFTYNWTPGNFKSASVENLQPGTYEVTVTAANGASIRQTAVIGEYEMNAKVSFVPPDCYGQNTGTIVLRADGGIQPYAYSIDLGNTFQETGVFKELFSGSYQLVVKDAGDCMLHADNIIVNEPSPLFISSVSATPVSCSTVKDGRLIISVSGGTPPYTYSIPGYIMQQDSVIAELDAGSYHYVISDMHNCLASGDADITKESRNCAVFIPNAFSPNGDGINDLFRIIAHDDIHDYHMAIYGRWGQLIFECNDPEKGWNGMGKGGSLPTGSYLYIITFTDSKMQARKEKGVFLLIR